MKRILLAAVGIVIALASAQAGTAACTFDTPYRAKTLKAELVHTFAECDVPDAVTATGQPACLTDAPESSYSFNASGRCTTRFATRLRTGLDCGDAPGNSPCSEVRVLVRCKGIDDPSSAPIAAGSAPWHLSMPWRMTIDDPGNGPMTVIDAPIAVTVPVNMRGGFKAKLSPMEWLELLFGSSGVLPGCANIALMDITLLDPLGDRMAAIGTSVAPVSAGCSVALPSKALGTRIHLVRAYAECPSPPIVAPNTSTVDGIPACVDGTGFPLPLSVFEFGKDGHCSFKAKAYGEAGGCKGDAGAPDCLHASIKLLCADVVDDVGDPIKPAADEWKVRLGLRATFDDRVADQTMTTDLSVEIGNRPNKPGKVVAEADLASLLAAMFGSGGSLPLCSSVEITNVEVIDDSGALFAVPGHFAKQ